MYSCIGDVKFMFDDETENKMIDFIFNKTHDKLNFTLFIRKTLQKTC